MSFYKTCIVLGVALLGANLWGRVVISAPLDGGTVSAPLQLSAVNQSMQTPSVLSVYDNSVLVFQQKNVSSVQTSLNLTPGSHTIEVLAQFQRGPNSQATSTVTVTSPPSSGAQQVPAISVAAQIADDMTGNNEGYPHGVPLSWDFAVAPVVEQGNNANGQQAITSWGVIYVASQGNPAKNTRVNIRDMQLYLLQKSTGKWLLLQNTSTPEGGAYPEDYQGNSINADIRKESDGTISVTAGNGYNFHFYPADRGAINPKDIGGAVAIFQARLIIANPALADDRSIAQYLAGAGADYYPSVSGPGIENNASVANGKMKYVQSSWRSYAMTTLTEEQLAENPPPVNLSGILP